MRVPRLLPFTVWIAAAGASLGACETVLDLERAQIDPALTAKPETTETPSPADEEPSSGASIASDAGGSEDLSSSALTPQCEGFDNARVKLLRRDGTLPPLPDAPTSAN